jgi:hypothetical protein
MKGKPLTQRALRAFALSATRRSRIHQPLSALPIPTECPSLTDMRAEAARQLAAKRLGPEAVQTSSATPLPFGKRIRESITESIRWLTKLGSS